MWDAHWREEYNKQEREQAYSAFRDAVAAANGGPVALEYTAGSMRLRLTSGISHVEAFGGDAEKITKAGTVRWQATCGREYLGWFKSEGEAAQAYNQAASEKYGEYANLNVL